MREDEHRKKKHGKVRHEDEFVLVEGRAFPVSVKKMGVNFITKQFDNVCHNQ